MSQLNFPHAAAPRSGLYFTFYDFLYLPNATINITDLGNDSGFENLTDPGTSLACVTRNVNTECCTENNVGEWIFPAGGFISTQTSTEEDFSQTGSTHQIRLNRRNRATFPIGIYICLIPDGTGNTADRAKITLGKMFSTTQRQ